MFLNDYIWVKIYLEDIYGALAPPDFYPLFDTKPLFAPDLILRLQYFSYEELSDIICINVLTSSKQKWRSDYFDIASKSKMISAVEEMEKVIRKFIYVR